MQDNFLFTQEEFDNAKTREYLPLLCVACDSMFLKEKRVLQRNEPHLFCSSSCGQKTIHPKIPFNCTFCGNPSSKKKSFFFDKRIKNHFCSQSCAASFNNTHKTTGNRRSKLEIWLEENLIAHFPKLNFEFNQKSCINSELDIYVPSLKLAFELNGIFHYEPIYGIEKLTQTTNNDARKFQACFKQGVELCIIDTSGQKYFKESTSQKYLDIIVKVINARLYWHPASESN
jgi:hypothetical protein